MSRENTVNRDELDIKSKMRRKKIIRENLTGYAAVFPVFAFIIVLFLIPLFTTFMKSFTDWNAITTKFIGFDNYKRLLTNDSVFWNSLINSLLILVSVPVQIIVGLIAALLLNQQVLGWKFFRAVYYIPVIIAAIVTGYLFRIAFSLLGPINTMLQGFNIAPVEWLSNRLTGIAVIDVALLWSNFGVAVLIFLGGLSTINPSIFEASIIDGATWWDQFIYIVVPMLVRVIEFFSVTTMIWMFTGIFPYVYSITGGGPGYTTAPLDYYVYMKAFNSMDEIGYSCALAFILFIFVFIISRVQMILSERADDWGE